MSTRNAISKLRGQENKILYPQPEGTLGDYMIRHGTDLGDDSMFGLFVHMLLFFVHYLVILKIFLLTKQFVDIITLS